ncbi:MAG: hypothetical protein ACXWC4_09755 [Telluria sp.]
MTRYFPYARNERVYLDVAARALVDHFGSAEALEAFYEAISTDERKNQFLRATSTYYYMVKHGNWIVNAPDCDPLIDYFTNAYKAVGLFAIIESLSDRPHQDFYEWLRENSQTALPINDKRTLSALHNQYKATYGSIRRCVEFFGRLSPDRQEKLCSAVKIDHEPVADIKEVAKYLYTIRSKFVHEADVVVELSGPTHHFLPDKYLYTDLTIPLFFSAFEEGLIAYFKETNANGR